MLPIHAPRSPSGFSSRSIFSVTGIFLAPWLLITALFLPATLEAGDNLAIPESFSGLEREGLEEARAALDKIQKSPESSTPTEERRLVQKLERLARTTRNDPLVNYYLSIAYQIVGKYDRAERIIKKVIKQRPEFHEALVELGNIYRWQREFKKALKTYDKAIELAPNDLTALERKYPAYLELGQYEKARDTLKEFLKHQESEYHVKLLAMVEMQLRGPPFPRKFRKESDNYIVLTSVSQEYADLVSDRMERILTVYRRIFPDIQKPDRKYEVWVYGSQQEYVRAGNPPGAGGHYEPLVRKLVLFRYQKLRDLELVINHEGFHQFLHDYIQQIPQWFNEGLADYYGGYVHEVRQGKNFLVPRPNPWRLKLIQQAIRYKRTVPAEELMQMSRGEMYNRSSVSIHYAQAWAMVYYCIEGGKSRRHDRVLLNYFKALRKGYDIEKAYQSTFGRVNMEAFDKAWKEYIAGL